jgi:beta-glucanase (GH16 family)
MARVQHCALLMLAAVSFAATPAPRATTRPATAPAPTIDPKDYQLVWSDEFNKDGPLDAKDWRFEQGFVRNQELQWYQPENAFCKDGVLVLEARREKRPNPRYVAGSQAWQTNREFIEYTSASVNTRGTHSWLYGRFETRARVDVSKGAWPAIWMLGTQGRWPANGEIDIMEYYQETILANFCWVGANGRNQWNTGRTPLKHFAPDFDRKFHTWRMDWDEKNIAIYLDDELLNVQDLSKTLNRGNTADNPFQRPIYYLLDFAIGGQGGDPTPSKFPLRYEIDWVRVYQTPAQQAATKAAAATMPAAR